MKIMLLCPWKPTIGYNPATNSASQLSRDLNEDFPPKSWMLLLFTTSHWLSEHLLPAMYINFGIRYLIYIQLTMWYMKQSTNTEFICHLIPVM